MEFQLDLEFHMASSALEVAETIRRVKGAERMRAERHSMAANADSNGG